MTNEKICELVKRLEPLLIGYCAFDNRLKNSNGMELVFRINWKNQTRVAGLHATNHHSIGCSFDKPIEKIAKDIRRRLIPKYYDDFFKTKRENAERAEFEEAERLRLKALAFAINGQICRNYENVYPGNSEYIKTNNASIYQTYNNRYEIRLNLDFSDTIKMAEFLKDFTLVDLTKIEIDFSK